MTAFDAFHDLIQHRLHQRQIQVFHGDHARGTRAGIWVLSRETTPSLLHQHAADEGLPASCYCWPAASGPGHWQVRCFSASGEIQCCGHGLLATGFALEVIDPADNNDQAPRFLWQPQAQRPLRYQQRHLYLPMLNTTAVPVPQWLQDAFPEPPLAAAIAGGEQGYWVLEWPAQTDLSALPNAAAAITQHSRRAVIATQAGDDDADYRLRYFAPQYGVEEDRVTGSAQRVLAPYWAYRLHRDHLIARQCSPEGGVVHCHVDNGTVGISGNLFVIEDH